MSFISTLPNLLAPAALILLSLVTAYVFRFGLPKTGIFFDYLLFAGITLLALVAGGAL